MNSKIINIQEYELPITIREEEDGFIATCPLWQDCYAQGDSIEEAISEISFVASSLIELYKEEGMEVPLKLKSTIQEQSKGFTLRFPLIVSSQ